MQNYVWKKSEVLTKLDKEEEEDGYFKKLTLAIVLKIAGTLF
jgi:hypothetical protein